jgi:carbamate kinase
VCSGGGGIPVVEEADGSWRGVEAVVDKDLTAAVVAEHLEADRLVIATDVPHVVTGWGTLQERPVGEVTVSEMKALAAREAFPAGSMGPKVAAVVEYVERVGGTGVITSLARLKGAVEGETGTRVVPDRSPEPRPASGH